MGIMKISYLMEINIEHLQKCMLNSTYLPSPLVKTDDFDVPAHLCFLDGG